MIIGYRISSVDNDSYMLEKAETIAESICAKCGSVFDFEYHNPFFKLKRKTYDYSNCSDIGDIVSLKLKEFCIREKFKGLIFKEFEREPDFFQFIVKNELEFDTPKAKTTFRKKCKACGRFNEVLGITPFFLKNVQQELSDGFYRTNIFFGSKNRKNPNIIVAPATHKKLLKEKLRGLYFEAIENSS